MALGDRIADAVLGAFTLRQVISSSVREGHQLARSRNSGSPVTAELSIIGSEPTVNVVSADCKGALDGIAVVGGTSVASGTITIAYQQLGVDGLPNTGSIHNNIAATDGLLVINNFSARKGDEQGATVDIDVHILSADGTTDPLTINTNAALAAQSFVKAYDMGPCAYDPDGVGALAELDAVTSIVVEPGVTVERHTYGGDDWPTQVTVTSYNPRITLGFQDLDSLQTFSTTAVTMDGISCFFKQRATDGRHTAAGSAAHLKFALGAGIAIVDTVDTSSDSRAEVSLVLEGKTLTTSSDVAIALS